MESSTELTKFIQSVNQSPDLLADVQKALEGSTGPGGLVAVAQKRGHKFSEDDVINHFKGILMASSMEDITRQGVKVIVGAKDTPDTDTNEISEIKHVIQMFRKMTFKIPPKWTGFSDFPLSYDK